VEHPIAEVMRRQGRRQTWLAREIEFSIRHTNQVIRGRYAASPEFRRRCADALGMAERDLFHNDSSASAPGSSDGSNSDRAGVAVA